MTISDGTVLGSTQIFGGTVRVGAFNVVLLADGFTSSEQSEFNVAADAFVAALLATTPYGSCARTSTCSG